MLMLLCLNYCYIEVFCKDCFDVVEGVVEEFVFVVCYDVYYLFSVVD